MFEDSNTPSSVPDDSTLTHDGTQSTAVRTIGPYRLLQKLGEGGMGEVWLSEQVTPIHRTVAIKLIKPGMDSAAVIARFKSERQALAMMAHPNIAQVFDAGATPDCRPYFVMEYVSGIAINAYCDKHRLSLNDRLKLFIQVCDGVQHAHQKAIIHRDLKPTNILVHLQDNKPIPKIIDFGLAKATAQRLTEKTMFTQLGVVVGTPAYMSPEQSDLTEQNVDTRTDVYSLGVILYELLVGALPLNPQELREIGFEAMLRKIRETDPPRPSTKVRSLKDEDSKIWAEKRKEEPRTLEKRLRGDLDWITMRALEKDKTRRYGSPSDLAVDIRHHLKNEPVAAGPPSTIYRAKKFVLRHKFSVAAAGITFLALVAFLAVMTVQAKRIARERDRANLEAETSRRVVDFVIGMFKLSDPTETRGNAVTVREVLDQGAKNISTGLANQPVVQSRLMATMGDVYANLGLYPQSESLLKDAVEKSRHVLSPEHPETLKAQTVLGWIYEKQGRYPEAEKLLSSTLETQKRVLGPENAATLETACDLSIVYYGQGRYVDADHVANEALAISRRTQSDDSELTLKLIHTLAVAYDGELKFAQEEPMWRELLARRERLLGPDHPDTISTMQNLGYIVRRQGHADEAESLLRTAFERSLRVFGPEHPTTLQIRNNFANVLMDQKKFPEAEKLQRENLEIRRRTLGENNPQTLFSINNLANVLLISGRLAEAESLFHEALKKEIAVLGPNHPEIGGVWYNLAAVEAQRGNSSQALANLHQAIAHGYADPDELAGDDLFLSLRPNSAFQAILTDLRSRAPQKE